MAKIIVYNNDTDRMETYYRGLNESMPYNTNRTLTVREFRGASKSDTLWTTKKTMTSWNSQRALYGAPIPVGYAFRRSWEGGHGLQSQHYAGVAFDVGQNLNYAGRLNLRNSAANSRVWEYVEPIELTPRWVHFDDRRVPSGYPLIRLGSRGNYVCILQDGLINLGYDTGGLDGVFGSKTNNAVRQYQTRNGLTVDGIVGNNTWRVLMNEVVGMGRTSTTID